jgi:hypothetical protein
MIKAQAVPAFVWSRSRRRGHIPHVSRRGITQAERSPTTHRATAVAISGGPEEVMAKLQAGAGSD